MSRELSLNPLARPTTRGTRKSRFSIDPKRLTRYLDAGTTAFAAVREANAKVRTAYEVRSNFVRETVISRRHHLQPGQKLELEGSDAAKLAKIDAQIADLTLAASRCQDAANVHGRIAELVKEYAEARQ